MKTLDFMGAHRFRFTSNSSRRHAGDGSWPRKNICQKHKRQHRFCGLRRWSPSRSCGLNPQAVRCLMLAKAQRTPQRAKPVSQRLIWGWWRMATPVALKACNSVAFSSRKDAGSIPAASTNLAEVENCLSWLPWPSPANCHPAINFITPTRDMAKEKVI